ncbi:MAG TPA: TlyA family RNA methyltransferase [Syntrophales bacterium]|nr:TlyA family RNA methyltransferase [Syntrophales bacterium]
MEKVRLDRLLVDRGLAPTRERARAMILSGAVLADERPADKAGLLVSPDAAIRLKGEVNPYVGRGGLKLKGALTSFGLCVDGIVALDVGAATGGFTDCLLKEGARKVYALDVGYGQLAWELRNDPRVVVLERTNIRLYDGRGMEERPELAVIDCSFISLRLVIPPVVRLLAAGGRILALVKPQFEVGREQVGKGGVVRDPALQEAAVEGIIRFCREEGLAVQGRCESPLKGPKGNREFFVLAAVGEVVHGR